MVNFEKKMQLFFEPEFEDNGFILNEEESYHCIRVLRHRGGDLIKVINGNGSLFNCRIRVADHKKCQLEPLNKYYEKAPGFICHIAIAPTKNIERFEWFIEKSTEIGIQTITPLLCRNSERKIIKQDRLEKIVTSAIKQSMGLWRPKLNHLVDFSSFINNSVINDSSQKFIAHCQPNNTNLLKNEYRKGNNIIMLIGPEGDFDPVEVELSMRAGFQPISFGEKRLRTETAGLVACHSVLLINQ